MTVYRWLILALWLLFAVVWGVSALKTKRTVGGRRPRMEIAMRLVSVAIVLLVVYVARHGVGHTRLQLMTNSPLLGIVGDVLCALGIGLAFWARFFLGRNWGMPMSLKENPELVTGGPYAYVRHPIYTGVLFAMIGSAIAISPLWLIPTAFSCVYFIYSARQEEKLMSAQFPEAYPAYMQRTKMLIPFVF
ncbi:MAG TPA: isoprenylcysteine carboxylmethyltransferase family protein [Oscillatoriaceae cyanobacterium]